MSLTVLGIDTSNYTTSLSVCTDGQITENIKIPLTVKKGGVGLRQSDAVFSHTVNLPEAFGRLQTDLSQIKAVGCSDKPRSVDGSYMPCFLCGINAAAIVSKSLNVPVYYNSHQQGHIKAVVYSSKMPDFERFYAYHLSGGTLELLTVTYDGENYNCEIKGKTLDITAGQLIDRAGVMLGLDFPCGAALERLAKENTKKIPKIKTCVTDCDCNLSGFENKVGKMKADGCEPSYIAAYVIEVIKQTIDKMTENALSDNALPLLFSGGVASNGILKDHFTKKYGAYFALPAFSSDNAAGTALITYQKVINGK